MVNIQTDNIIHNGQDNTQSGFTPNNPNNINSSSPTTPGQDNNPPTTPINTGYKPSLRKPGLGGMPFGLENVSAEEETIANITPEKPKQETISSLEKVKVPESIYSKNSKEKSSEPNKDDLFYQEEPDDDKNTKIVDKTGKLTHIHHIKNPQDKLTGEADEEEEFFIEEVEKHHGH